MNKATQRYKIRKFWPAIEQYLNQLVNGLPIANDENNIVDILNEGAKDTQSEEERYIYTHQVCVNQTLKPLINITIEFYPEQLSE